MTAVNVSTITDDAFCVKHQKMDNANSFGGLSDRKSVVQGKSVDLGGRRIIKKKKKERKKKRRKKERKNR